MKEHFYATHDMTVTYKNYHRGEPKVVELPQRYSSEEVAETMSFSRNFDDNGWLTELTDLNGNKTSYGYDLAGRLAYIDRPTGWSDSVYTWTLLVNGSWEHLHSRCSLDKADYSCQDGTAAFSERVLRDNWLRPTLTQRTHIAGGDSIHRYQAHRYNYENNMLFESFWARSSSTTNIGKSYAYDPLQRLEEQTTTGLGSVKSDYLNGNRTKITDAESHVTTTYRAYGQPAYDQAVRIESPESVTTTLNVDLFGLVKSITQGGQTEHRAYNVNNQLCKVYRNDVGQTVYGRNALGQVTWHAQGVTGGATSNCEWTNDDDLKVIYTYDNIGQVRTIKYPDTSLDLTYSYDNQGNLLTLQAGTVKHTYTYNTAHLLESDVTR
ncbi:hypothetical protein EYS14_16950 [Alteromonadaceae bacterium M269]|nr:hypothetical protein EYS14_16950 [Alteromonadaceae bacterium M269]